jgi:hypothetical protein
MRDAVTQEAAPLSELKKSCNPAQTDINTDYRFALAQSRSSADPKFRLIGVAVPAWIMPRRSHWEAAPLET